MNKFVGNLLVVGACALVAGSVVGFLPRADYNRPPSVEELAQAREVQQQDSVQRQKLVKALLRARATQATARRRAERGGPAPYLVVSSADERAFSQEVSLYLQEGYELRGPMQTVQETGEVSAPLRYVQNLTYRPAKANGGQGER